MWRDLASIIRYFVVLSLLVAAAGSAEAQFPIYTVTDLNVPADYGIYPLALNNAGQVTGYLPSTFQHAAIAHMFLYDGSIVQDLGTCGGFSCAGFGINDAGAMVGIRVNNIGPNQAIVVQNGVIRQLSGSPRDFVSVTSINNAGQIAGSVGPRAVRWNASGGYVTMGLPRNIWSSANDINELGWVVGFSETHGSYHAFLNRDGTNIDLGTLGGFYSVATAVNDLGQIVGVSDIRAFGPRHGFLYSDGVMHDITPDIGNQDFDLIDINNSGMIIGTRDYNPFLYYAGAMRNLESLIPSHDGWHLEDVYAINDRGQIVGVGYRDDLPYERAFLLTPTGLLSDKATVAEPGALVMLGGLAVSGMLCVFRFKHLLQRSASSL